MNMRDIPKSQNWMDDGNKLLKHFFWFPDISIVISISCGEPPHQTMVVEN